MQGVKHCLLSVVVVTKITKSRLLGIYALISYYNYHKSVDIGEKLISVCFELLNSLSGINFRLEPILSPQTAKTTKVPYSNSCTQVINLLHSMGGQNLREREREYNERSHTRAHSFVHVHVRVL